MRWLLSLLLLFSFVLIGNMEFSEASQDIVFITDVNYEYVMPGEKVNAEAIQPTLNYNKKYNYTAIITAVPKTLTTTACRVDFGSINRYVSNTSTIYTKHTKVYKFGSINKLLRQSCQVI